MPMTDRPDDHIIADDRELDAWFKRWIREQARKMGKSVGDESLDLLPEKRPEPPAHRRPEELP